MPAWAVTRRCRRLGAVNTFQIGDTLTHVLGTHTLSYGVDMRSVQRGNFTVDNNYRGAFGFTGFVTGGLGQLSSQEQAGLEVNSGFPVRQPATASSGTALPTLCWVFPNTG